MNHKKVDNRSYRGGFSEPPASKPSSWQDRGSRKHGYVLGEHIHAYVIRGLNVQSKGERSSRVREYRCDSSR
eukprot:COSAG02_NODE_102_length_36716_cov_233.851025_6_plen_72_part_00